MKSGWYHIIEAILFFLVLGVVYNILDRINVNFNPIILAIILVIVWSWVNLRINKKLESREEESIEG